MINRPKRITNKGIDDELYSDELICVYTVEFDSLPDHNDNMRELGVAMLTLFSALPEDRLWGKPNIYLGELRSCVYIEGLKKKVYDESKAG